jgi:hypothetical protein
VARKPDPTPRESWWDGDWDSPEEGGAKPIHGPSPFVPPYDPSEAGPPDTPRVPGWLDQIDPD